MSTAINNNWVDKEFTQKDHSNSEKVRHIKKILDYELKGHLDYGLKGPNNSGSRNRYKSMEKRDSDAIFAIPIIKSYLPFDRKNYFTKVQSWIGYVTSIDDTTFSCKLEDAYNPTSTYEEATFDKEEIPDDDQTLLAIGSVFYWSVGFEYRNGTKIKESLLKFKRLPKWNMSDYDAAADMADDLYKNLNWD